MTSKNTSLLDMRGTIMRSQFALMRKVALCFFVIFHSVQSLAEDIVAQEEKVKFEIKGIVVDGNTIISSEKFNDVLQPYISHDATIDTLQAALIAVEKVYAEAGYTAIKAVLPEQEADAGVFNIHVIEAKVGQIKVTGNEYFSLKNILNSAPDLVVGQSPNLLNVAKSLRIANESFAKYTRVVIVKSVHADEVDAELKVQDASPRRFAVSLDNTGTKQTGRQRLSLVFQHANLFDLDHAMAAQYTTSPEHEDQVKIFGISYRIPIYSLADTIDISLGRSDVNSGNITTTAGNFGISGSGDYASLNYNHALPVWHDIEQRLSLGLNWRSFESEVRQEGGPDLIPDLTSAPASITYTMSQQQNERRWLASVGLVHNLPSGDDGDTDAYNQAGARQGATSHFNLIRYQLAYSRPLTSKLNLGFELNGQHTRNLLISGEQFGIGGAGSVRGFDLREVNGDKGFRTSLELSSTPIALFKNMRLVGVGFYDYGYTERNDPQPGEVKNEALASAGAGLRLSANNFQLKLDVARALNGSPNYDAGEYQGHFEMVYIF